MCKTADVIKLAAVAAAVYTGGASLGAWGAAEGAAAGAGALAGAEGAGAAAGTMAAANAAGAVGGDALGTLIAGNAANWGVSVAPELLAAGAGVAGAASGGSGTGAGTGITMSKLASGASLVNTGMGLLSTMKGQKTPPSPSLLSPIVMPTPDDLATQRARKAMLATLSQRRGRTSTILSNDSLGGS